jgi:competence protein ComEA
MARALLVASMVLAVTGVAAAEPLTRSLAVNTPSNAGRTRADGVVNLNQASAEELELLPGIGPGKARAIVEHRRTHPFRKIEEIVKVKGIGRKTFAKLRQYIAVAGPTTLKEEKREAERSSD